jgi:hypothetical protein
MAACSPSVTPAFTARSSEPLRVLGATPPGRTSREGALDASVPLEWCSLERQLPGTTRISRQVTDGERVFEAVADVDDPRDDVRRLVLQRLDEALIEPPQPAS